MPKKLNVLHCVHCGAANKLSDSSADVGTCASCGKVPVEALPLLIGPGLWSGDFSTCAACGIENSLFHTYCFGCGKKVGTR